MTTRKRAPRRKRARLTVAEDKAWVYAFGFYVEQGMSDAQADRRAWKDVRLEFPRLRKFDGCR